MRPPFFDMVSPVAFWLFCVVVVMGLIAMLIWVCRETDKIGRGVVPRRRRPAYRPRRRVR